MEHHQHTVCNENEKKTLWITILTFVTMVAEIIYGYLTNSMGLLADGYHMGTHVLALSLAYVAYVIMRCCAKSERFPHGTAKIGTLAAYTSSMFLGLTGIWIIIEATLRFFNPLSIQFGEAIVVAIIGLAVNVVSILIMDHGHDHGHEHHSSHQDYNFKAAYYHILADILTSVLAIIALVIGKYTDFIYLDAVVGGLGGLLIVKWAVRLLKHTIVILIDMKNK